MLDESQLKNCNIFLLGLAFFLLFTAFQTTSNTQTIVLASARDPNITGHVLDFQGDGYISLGIVYVSSGLSNWLAPSALHILGLKSTLIFGAVTYAVYVGTFLHLNDYLLYGASSLLGFGAALLWTAQGAFVITNSAPATVTRNSNIFWAIYQMSLLAGNTFVYFQFRDKVQLDGETRLMTAAVLTSIAAVGVVAFFLILPMPWLRQTSEDNCDDASFRTEEAYKDTRKFQNSPKVPVVLLSVNKKGAHYSMKQNGFNYCSNSNYHSNLVEYNRRASMVEIQSKWKVDRTSCSRNSHSPDNFEEKSAKTKAYSEQKKTERVDIAKENEPTNCLTEFKHSLQLFLTPKMLQLLFFFCQVGAQVTFQIGVYGSCLGFTMNFDDPKGLAGLHGIATGLGEVTSGLIFSIFGHVTVRVGRYPVVFLGSVLQLTSLVLVLVNIPADAPFGDTHQLGLVFQPSSVLVALVCSLLLGFADACHQTQLVSLIGGLYPNRVGPAFAISKFVQCLASATAFGYSGYISLPWQLVILGTLNILGTICFCKVEIQDKRTLVLTSI